MRVLVACEFSGAVRDAFIARGHDAWSCDLLPGEGKYRNRHIQGDIRKVLSTFPGVEGPVAHMYEVKPSKFYFADSWDLLIAHPPCTCLTNAGARWLYKGGKGTVRDPQRWRDMHEGVSLFLALQHAPIKRICIENPIPHRHAREHMGTYSQLIQPYQYGHGETKATCLWLKGLPKLTPTNIVEGREARIHRMSPGPNRSKERSKTYAGIAAAMAAQWG